MSIFEILVLRACRDRDRIQQIEEARQADRENQQTTENKETPPALAADLELDGGGKEDE